MVLNTEVNPLHWSPFSVCNLTPFSQLNNWKLWVRVSKYLCLPFAIAKSMYSWHSYKEKGTRYTDQELTKTHPMHAKVILSLSSNDDTCQGLGWIQIIDLQINRSVMFGIQLFTERLVLYNDDLIFTPQLNSTPNTVDRYVIVYFNKE